MVNGEEYTTVDSNKYTGKYSAQIECEPDGNIITVQAVCGSNKSDKVQINADENVPVLVDFDVTHYTHGTDHWTKDMTDIFRTGYSPFVPYNPGRPFEFDVELDNDDNVGTAYVFSETNDDISFVPLEKDSETGRWVGEGFFDTTLPGDLYIGQTPKSAKGVAVEKKNADGSTSLEFNGKDLLNNTPENIDPVKELIDNSEIKVLENTQNRTAVKVKTPVPPAVISDWFPDSENIDEFEVNLVQEIFDNFDFGDGAVSSDKAAEAPEDYGFTESGVELIDAEGESHTIYIRTLTEDSDVRTLTENVKMEDGGSVYDFLKSGNTGDAQGVIILDKNTDSGKTSYLTEFFNESKDLQKDTAGGIAVSLFTEGLKDTVQGAAKGVTVLAGVAQNGIDLYGSYQGYSDTLEQIDYSKNEYVRKNSKELKAQAKAIYYTRVLVAAGAVTIGAAVTFASAIPCAIGIAIGAAVGFGSWLLGKLLDKAENNLKSKVYVTPKGEIKEGIDPSGFVYAAVPENRVEGATATIYYKDDSGKAVKWNAEDYDQINPQITDSEGWFMWDVPEGLWQVKIEAEGYETYTTEWLPVLPVQTDVNIPLKGTSAAKIDSIDAHTNGVNIKMTQFITDSTAIADNVYLTDSKGNTIPCRIRFSKSETNDTGFSDVITLIAESGDITGAELHITKGLLSYSGVASEAVSRKIGETDPSPIIDNDPDILLGDINNDGKINAVDASNVLSYYANISTSKDGGFTDAQKKAADVNKNGVINAVDASQILSYYAYTSTTKEEVLPLEKYLDQTDL
jgi:hypothetical protein